MTTVTLPPLAGVATYAAAAAAGYSVAEATAALHRLAYGKHRLAIMAAAHLPSTPEWELKGALALHAWLDAEHAASIARRIAELREPPPRPDDVPDGRLAAALDEALASATTGERITAMYGVLRPALLGALRQYLTGTNPLADQPSCRLLRLVLAEEEDIARWGDRAFAAAQEADQTGCSRWGAHVHAYLQAAGGVMGSSSRGAEPLPAPRARRPWRFDLLPARDARFGGLFDVSTPADLAYLDDSRPADERNAALLFKRLREMDVPEVIAGIVAERWAQTENDATAPRLPWDYYVNMLRQMWDEARHSMLGETALEAGGIDWRRLPINVTFSYKLAKHCSPIERHILLYAIEQSLMPRARGKPYEHLVARESGDRLSALFHDFDWADEVLHVEIARRCLRPELPGGLIEARDRADALWQRITAALEHEPLPADDTVDPDWWVTFARAVTGHDVAPPPDTHVKDWRPLRSG